jgi:hypothetical protein
VKKERIGEKQFEERNGKGSARGDRKGDDLHKLSNTGPNNSTPHKDAIFLKSVQHLLSERISSADIKNLCGPKKRHTIHKIDSKSINSKRSEDTNVCQPQHIFLQFDKTHFKCHTQPSSATKESKAEERKWKWWDKV